MDAILSLLPFWPLVQGSGYTLNNWLNFTIWLIIISIFIFMLAKLLLSRRKLGPQLDEFRRIIDKYRGTEFFRRDTKQEIERKLKRFAHQWNEYDETMVEYSHNGQIRICNTIDSATFFNAETLAPDLVGARIVSALPGFLTGLGLFGTFLGLALGLNGLDIENTEPDRLIGGIAMVISGAKLAFSTSVWGVLCALLFSMLEKILVEEPVKRKIAALQEFIDQVFPRITAEEKLAEISNSSYQSKELLAVLAEKIGDQLQKTMSDVTQKLGEEFGRQLQELLKPALGTATGQNGELLSKLLDQFMTEFRDIASKPGEQMQAAADSTRIALESLAQETQAFISKLNDSIGRQEARDEIRNERLQNAVALISESSKSASDQLRSATEKLIEKLTSITGEISQNAQSAEQQRMAAFDQTTTGLANLMLTQTEKVGLLLKQGMALEDVILALRKVADEITSVFRELENGSIALQGFGNSIRESSSTLATNLVRAANTIDKFDDSYAKVGTAIQSSSQTITSASGSFNTIVEKFRTLQDEIQNEHDRYLKGLREAFAKALADYGREVSDQTNHRLSEWNDQTRDYTTKMTNVVQTIGSIVDSIDEQLAKHPRAS